MTEFKYLIITPKCYAASKETFDKFQEIYPHISIIKTNDIYMNMLDGLTSLDECDNLVYLLKELPKKKEVYDFVPPLPPETPEIIDQ